MSNYKHLLIHSLVIEPADDYPTWVVATVFCVPFIGGLILYFYKTRHARLWRKGIYPPKNKFTEDNLLEAYLAMGSLLILLDYQKMKGKTQFINEYFNRYFKSSNYNFGDSLLFSMNHPTQINTVTDWLNKHLLDDGKKSQVIYFLTGLAFLNESITKRELAFLQLVTNQLKLPKETLLRNIAIFEQYKASQKDQEKQQKTTVNRNNKKRYSEILNVTPNASLTEIKKAYRSMVKLHHPDVFVGASDAQQRMAAEKFIQIQEAYDQLVAGISKND